MLSQTEILAKTDHTLLKQDTTTEEILALCADAVRFSTASVCIPPRFVKTAYDFLKDQLPVCTVIGFPLGYQSLRTKACEAEDSIQNGAQEIDMVIPIGELKAANHKSISEEIRTIRSICADRVLKVIVETCLLTDDEKKAITHIVADCGADFIKTSTGFAKGGACVEDIRLFKATCPQLSVKASGGIRSFEFANELIHAGADRIGASALVELCK